MFGVFCSVNIAFMALSIIIIINFFKSNILFESVWNAVMDILFSLKWQIFCTGTAEEVPPAEETDAQPVKRAAEEEEVGWHQA